ncbi:MAG: UDP-N-acetylmuramoyl-tripeptide--D-alanyl-D-alanine ligase [Pedosphaera sp.]|nr:UDP-N-acetylmuramoyl-tripeptide--D-alanyl-D-alanine ligase [Pedosphaera sp.]
MEPRDLAFVVSACAGELRDGLSTLQFRRVVIDSRQAQAGDLFFAIKGERFDGHDFLDEVAAKGAVAVVVERRRIPAKMPDCAVIAVDDVRAALGQLAAAYRKEFAIPVVAVGGSNGKTSTKELIAGVLRQKLATLWSEASFNNDIGVPMTLLRLDQSHQVAVLEAGTNHPGELAPLVRMIQPRYGVITTVGREHLEFFGDVAGVAAEEGWLAELLPADGKLFVNGDNEWTDRLVARTKAKVVCVGFNAGNDWRVSEVKLGVDGATFQVTTAREDFCGGYQINLLGRHQVLNALFAISIGEELGLARGLIQRGLAECRPAKMRLQSWEADGVRVLDDAYNANADSMLAALEVLRDMPCQGRRVAVLGDMAELGAHSEDAHAEVGRRAAESGVDQLFAVGKMSEVMARGARAAGLNRVIELADVEVACGALKSFLKPGDVVLLKASRSTRLERVSEILRVGKA